MKNPGYPGPAATLIYAGLFFFIILASGCSGLRPTSDGPSTTASPAVSPGNASWKDYPLTDVTGKGNFSVSSFPRVTVLVPVLSASCPACTILLNQQLNEIDLLNKNRNGSVVVVALDIDPASWPDYITSYHSQFNFSGYRARSPVELTLTLFNTYGPFAIDPTSVPVILVCPDGHDLLLPAGVKTAATLDTLLTKEC